MCEAAAAVQAPSLAAAAAPAVATAVDNGDRVDENDAQRPQRQPGGAANAKAPPPSALPLALVKPADAAPSPTPPHSNGTGDSPPPAVARDPPPPAPAPVPVPLPQAERRTPAPAAEPPAPAPPPETPDRAVGAPETEAAPDAPAGPPRVNGDEALPPAAVVAPEAPAPPPPAENGVAEPPERKVDEEPAEAVRPAPPAPPATSPAPPARKKTEIKPKSTLKLATVTPALSRKRKPEAKSSPDAPKREGPSPPKRAAVSPGVGSPEADGASEDTDPSSSLADSRASKRNRTKVQPYQSPTPELAIVAKLSASQGRSTPPRPNDDKLIVFYKNEFLAVRNAEGGFYVCQTMQNVYRTSRKIKIRWLSQVKTADPTGEIYKPDFYDITDIECVLTTLSLQRSGVGLKLGASELARTQSILGRALAAERGEPAPDTSVTEEHPDGLDLSLYKDESQLETKKHRGAGTRKRPYSKSSPRNSKNDISLTDSIKLSPRKRSSLASKKRKTKSPSKSKSLSKSKSPKKVPSSKDKQTSNNSLPPISASTTNKTATPGKVLPKGVSKKSTTPKSSTKNLPARPKKSLKSLSKVAAAAKVAQIVSTPSTSTGKTTRTPRKPPSKK